MTALRFHSRCRSVARTWVFAVILTGSTVIPAVAQTLPALTSPSSVPANPAANPTSPLDEPAQRQEAVPQPAPLGSPDEDAIPTANYSDAKMSVDYPATWQVEIDADNMVSIQNDAAAPQAITQVFRVAAPPGPLVNANIDSFVEEGATVRRYSSVTIDEQDALMIWLSDRPDDLSNAIATFIGYGNETVFLFSRYSPDADLEQPAEVNPGAEASFEDSLLRLHSSFQNLEDVSNPTENTMPTDPEE